MTGNWKTGSGLIDEFDFTITDAEFRYNPKIQDGESPQLILIGLNSVTGDPEEELRFTVGKSFEIVDKGAKIAGVHAKANVNRQSQYGKFMNAFMDNEAGAGYAVSRDMDPFIAQSWVGLTLTLERLLNDATINGNKVTMTEWIVHEVAEAGAKKKPTKKAAAKKPAETPAEEVAEEVVKPVAEVAEVAADEGIPARVKAAATSIAKGVNTYEEFVDKTYEDIDGIVGQSWEDELLSEEFYNQARG